jgi:hypothetical protein
MTAHFAIRELRACKNIEAVELREALMGIATRANEAADDLIDAIKTPVGGKPA